MTTEAQATPLEQAPLVARPEMAIAAPAATAAPATEAPAAAKRPKKARREERWERRRRRMWFEEVLGWILVPLILVGLYYIVVALLGALGTSPSAIMNGISAITSNL
jgi:hypothetical protein